MRFSPQQTIIRRYLLRDGRISSGYVARVVSDDERGLLTWVDSGHATVQRVTADGGPPKLLSCNEKVFEPTTLTPMVWRSTGTLMFSPDDAAHSVWWFFDENREFTRWYVNLETPGRRWAGGRDCVDQSLDIWIDPGGNWEWKDEAEFVDYTGRPGYWDAEEAARIRAEGMAVVERAQAGVFPFDGTWCDFTPDPTWQVAKLPWWWDQTPDQSSAVPPLIEGATGAPMK